MKRTIKKIVLTGGPCAGKTTLTRVIEQVFHDQVVVVPEAASMLFSGGFRRWPEPQAQDATQRAIYSVQCELESAYGTHFPGKVLIMDRGTLDGAAYWSTGSKDFFSGIGSSLEMELQRYDLVLYLESAGKEDFLLNTSKNPNRHETWEEARALDEQTRALWSKHPFLLTIHNRHSFDFKISQTLKLISQYLDLPTTESPDISNRKRAL